MRARNDTIDPFRKWSVHRISRDSVDFLWEPSRRSPDVATNYGLDRGFGVTLRPRYGLRMRLKPRRI